MYKSTDCEYEQLSFINFNMACGMQLDMNNEWIRIAQQLSWRAWGTLYVAMFPSNTGNVSKPCRMVLGSLILQTRLGFSDRELVDQLRQTGSRTCSMRLKLKEIRTRKRRIPYGYPRMIIPVR